MAEAVGFEPTCPCGQLHFECSSLQPLRYASVYKYSLFGTNHMISSAAPSTTRTTLRVYFRPVFFPEICSKIRWRENRRDGKKYSILRFSVLRNIKEKRGGRKSQVPPKFRVLFAFGTFVSAVVGGGSLGNGENPCAATDFGRADRY